MFTSLPGARLRALTVLAGSVLAVAGSGCNTRDRLPFPGGNGPDEVGPSTVIDEPAQDTTVAAGPGVFVNGRTLDDDGIDTVYFETEGGITTFPPFVGGGTSVRFGLPITTNQQAGEVITVRVFGTDRLGNRGDTATRQITVQ